MSCEVEYTDEFEQWWENLNEDEQVSVAATVGLLEEYGINLRFPHCSQIQGSQFGQMRELRIQHQGKPYRVLYAFDPVRHAILLLGGDKTGNNRWYEIHVPIAEKLFQNHLATLAAENVVSPKKG
ncbi:type II toxin-antitoxin system RelE/ParE family toxin [Alysiella filiformis]|uniref:Addiction module toxin RelE n=1 Tax=Alysiella filiformis DSM 16848 TaxID=1120981 RepID=A0A286E9B3_9NEIS|nr:type II toxin-antitoxin system RelE/ParE family toxin [Alysiella filiformis]QMT31446.1 type II toxin-antitoxin system RelE/ParE family toxin [Alysiella filiformis]UBQ55542.1 type II toxin-antitoxin system RelE/ParE family toxin [Alysiella filiformis DSM 16848]SOD67444.1 hypothetical protein SAMN02746062_00906 [Alysiella filiformis DSM 16848]